MIRVKTFEEFVTAHNWKTIEQCWLPIQVNIPENNKEDKILILVLHSIGKDTEPDIWASSILDSAIVSLRLDYAFSQDEKFREFCIHHKITTFFGDVRSAYYMENSLDVVDADDEDDLKLSVESVLWSIKAHLSPAVTIKVISSLNPNLE